MKKEEIIFFDAEFTGNEEMLELSIFNGAGEEIYHRYFKPITAKKWNSDIHHITPGMVSKEKSFFSCIPEIQPIFDRAKILSGFSVKNDIKILEEHGIQNLQKKILDIHDFFWFINKDEISWHLDSIPSLVKCAQYMGIDFKEEEAHSASIDTLMTYRCYERLGQLFNERYLDGKPFSLSSVPSILEAIDNAKIEYWKQKATGLIRVARHPQGYILLFNHQVDSRKAKIEIEIPTENRFKAEFELRKQFRKKRNQKLPFVYNLSAKDLEIIRNYKNTYNKEEVAFYKLLLKNPSKITLLS